MAGHSHSQPEGQEWVVNRLLEDSHIRVSCNAGLDHELAVCDNEPPASLAHLGTGKFGHKATSPRSCEQQGLEEGRSFSGHTSVPLPRERFWDVQVAKIDSPTLQPMCPGSFGSAGFIWRRQAESNRRMNLATPQSLRRALNQERHGRDRG
jgi:hypothetical protein